MPVLTASRAGVRHRRRWLFRELDVTVEPGELVAVVGPPGSGRTTVLLALAKRFRLTTGKIQIAGTAALGHVPDVSQPEPGFSVAEHVRERLALLGRPARSFGDVPLLGLDPEVKGWQLSPYERQLLGLVLARLEEPRVIALDGLDVGLDAAEQAELWRLLRGIAESGVAVLVTARDVDEEGGVTLIRLGGLAGGATDGGTASGGAGSALDAGREVDGSGPLSGATPALAGEGVVDAAPAASTAAGSDPDFARAAELEGPEAGIGAQADGGQVDGAAVTDTAADGAQADPAAAADARAGLVAAADAPNGAQVGGADRADVVADDARAGLVAAADDAPGDGAGDGDVVSGPGVQVRDRDERDGVAL